MHVWLEGLNILWVCRHLKLFRFSVVAFLSPTLHLNSDMSDCRQESLWNTPNAGVRLFVDYSGYFATSVLCLMLWFQLLEQKEKWGDWYITVHPCEIVELDGVISDGIWRSAFGAKLWIAQIELYYVSTVSLLQHLYCLWNNNYNIGHFKPYKGWFCMICFLRLAALIDEGVQTSPVKVISCQYTPIETSV